MAVLDQKAAREVMREELQLLSERIAANMRAAGEVASGKTIRSMHVETTEQQGTLFGRAFFGTLETGRKAGRVPRNFSSIIYQWMQDKNVHAAPMPYKRDGDHKYSPQERGDRSMAAAIAYTIKKKGTKLFRSGGRSDIYSNEIPKTISAISERIGKMLIEEVQSIKLNDTTIS